MARIDDHPMLAVVAPSPQNEALRNDSVPSGVRELSFDVFGTPIPQGSKNAFPAKRKDGTYTGKVSVVESGGDRLKVWRSEVQAAAMVAKVEAELPPFIGPVVVDVVFFLPRPTGHYGTGRNEGRLKDSAPAVPVTKPDGDKLLRAVCDALTSAAVYRDDSQVVVHVSQKRYADDRAPGASILVRSYEPRNSKSLP